MPSGSGGVEIVTTTTIPPSEDDILINGKSISQITRQEIITKLIDLIKELIEKLREQIRLMQLQGAE